MRVERIELSGIGPFEDAVFDFGPEPEGDGELVLFEGPNGSGKSTVLEAIALAAGQGGFPGLTGATGLRFNRRLRGTPELRRADVRTSDGEIKLVRQRGSLSTDALRLGLSDVRWAAFAYRPHMTAPSLATPGPRDIDQDALEHALSFGEPYEPPGSLRRDQRAPFQAPAALLGQLLVNLDNDRLKAFAGASRLKDAQGDASALQKIQSEREARIANTVDALSRLVDRKIEIEFPLGQQIPTMSFDGDVIPLDLLGDGLRSTMAWSADLLVRLALIDWADKTKSPLEQEFWLILDEIEEGLHPQLQARVLPTIRELFPQARIYTSTHSPFVVASVGEGVVFPLRPGNDHRVRGEVKRRALVPGESLELVTSDIFRAPTGFVDEATTSRLRAHQADVDKLRRGEDVDWNAFLKRREWLFSQNDELKTAAAFEEVPVREKVRAEIQKRAEAAE